MSRIGSITIGLIVFEGVKLGRREGDGYGAKKQTGSVFFFSFRRAACRCESRQPVKRKMAMGQGVTAGFRFLRDGGKGVDSKDCKKGLKWRRNRDRVRLLFSEFTDRKQSQLPTMSPKIPR